MHIDLLATLGIILIAVVYVIVRLGKRKGCGCGCSCGSEQPSRPPQTIQGAPCSCKTSKKSSDL